MFWSWEWYWCSSNQLSPRTPHCGSHRFYRCSSGFFFFFVGGQVKRGISSHVLSDSKEIKQLRQNCFKHTHAGIQAFLHSFLQVKSSPTSSQSLSFCHDLDPGTSYLFSHLDLSLHFLCLGLLTFSPYGLFFYSTHSHCLRIFPLPKITFQLFPYFFLQLLLIWPVKLYTP